MAGPGRKQASSTRAEKCKGIRAGVIFGSRVYVNKSLMFICEGILVARLVFPYLSLLSSVFCTGRGGDEVVIQIQDFGPVCALPGCTGTK